jgi:hypothetical protein
MNKGEQANLGQQLIDDAVAHAGPAVRRATLLEDRIELVEDDNVQLALVALLLVLK